MERESRKKKKERKGERIKYAYFPEQLATVYQGHEAAGFADSCDELSRHDERRKETKNSRVPAARSGF